MRPVPSLPARPPPSTPLVPSGHRSIKGPRHTDTTLQEVLPRGGFANHGTLEQRKSHPRRHSIDKPGYRDKAHVFIKYTCGWSSRYRRGSSLTMMHMIPGCMIRTSPSSILQREGKQDMWPNLLSSLFVQFSVSFFSKTDHDPHSLCTA